MLDCLRKRDGASARKLRLFAVACVKRVWGALPGEEHRQALRVAERYADRQATAEELASAYLPVEEEVGGIWHLDALCSAVASDVRPRPDTFRCRFRPEWVGRAVAAHVGRGQHRPSAEEYLAQAALLRCIFGNPVRPASAIAASVLAWNNGTVRKLAAAVHDDCAFDRLPVLADALEDAGCADPEILGHCRSGGEHARGCWVVDQVLGKA
jgi:hypothetical protein